MADISLVVEVKQKGVVNAVKGTKALEGNVKLLSDSFKKGDLSQRQYYKGISQLAQAANKSESELRKYANELRKIEKASANAKVAAKAEATAVKAYAQARREATEANARFNAKAKEATAVARANTLEEERLKNKFVEGYTAMNIYTKELNDLAVARKRGIIGANEQAAAVARLNTQMKAGTGVFANSAAGMQVVGKRANRAGVLAQQAGYQFGDFAVQVQSGTNFMVAAGQQATQLVGTFSMLAKTTRGIMAFSALGVIIPVITGIAAAFMRTKEAADDSSLAVKAFEERLKTAKEETVEMAEKLRFLQSGFGTESEFALHEDFAAASAELERLESRLANAKGPNTYFESEANRLVSIGLLEDSIVLQGQEKDLAEAALKTYLETLAALELEEFQRQENLRLQEEAEAAAERYQALVDKTNDNYEKQLTLLSLTKQFGEDSVEVARERARQEAVNKGLLGAEIGIYINQQMILRQIVAEIDEAAVATAASADAAERFARALKSAALAGQTLASLKFEFSAGGRAMSLYAGRGTTSDRSIEGDLPEGYGKEVSPQGGGGGGSDPFDQDAYLKSLQEEADFKQSLVGINDEAVANMERRREITKRIEDEGLVADEDRILNILLTEAATRKAIEAEEQRQATFDKVSGHIESAFMAMVDGSKSVEDAFKGMIRSILLDVYQQAVAKPMANAITSFLGFKDGGAFSGGNVIPFANGGVVSSATMFPMAGKQTGVMGEAGPEAIMPLKRGANGKLGVQVQGGGENVVIHQNFNFQANGDDSVKRIIAQAAPQIANMTKKSMIDDRRRGGQMKATFG